MKQKDYKAIAEIIKRAREFNTGSLTDAWRYKFNDILLPKLADYFEKEELTEFKKEKIFGRLAKFDRYQFLEDCGVD